MSEEYPESSPDESPLDEAPVRVREYAEMLTELTNEIQGRLTPSPGTTAQVNARRQ